MSPSLADAPEQSPDPALLDAAWSAIRARLGEKLLVAGICGAQGSGKSTLALALARRAEAHGVAAAVLSLDDLYLTRAEREVLAREVHLLFATRGPPGTHDVTLGLEVLAALERGEPAPLPRFDKGRDDRMAKADWDRAPPGTRLLIVEGWCLGAVPQSEADLFEPINALEREEDREGIWRTHANRALGEDYAPLFARLDLLILLAAPTFDIVARWRGEQESKLPVDAPAAMDAVAIARFVQHYERLTRHILAEMPSRADLVAWLNEDRSLRAIEVT